MASNKYVRLAALLLRIALGAVFIYAAYTKLFQFVEGRPRMLPWQLFAMAIDSYQLLPAWAVELLAKTLPWFEVLLGVLLLVGRWKRFATATTSLLLVVFLTLIVRAYLKGQEISCGCFGTNETISWKTLLRDGSMLAGSFFVTAMAFAEKRGTGRKPEVPVQ
jgi:uncharacterized membrane protein YphA (DoxX/SURF4 family)